MHKLAAFLFLLLGLAAVPALAAKFATDAVAITVPAGVVSHVGDALVGAIVAALGWLYSHRKLLRSISAATGALAQVPEPAAASASPAIDAEALAKAVIEAIEKSKAKEE